MRKLFSAFLALGMLMTGFFGVAAQDVDASYATGLDTPATWTDERGTPVATVVVNEINPEWTDYSEYSAPEVSSVYRAVTFTVTNVSGSSLIVEPYDFSLVDEFGRNIGRTYVSPVEEAEGTIFEDDLPLAAGESAELTMVFETLEIAAPNSLVWQADTGILVIIGGLGEGSGEDAAVVSGLDTPSTWTDDRGNAVATLEVTGIDEDWQDFGEYSEPERGMVYRAVHIRITNVSGSSMIVEPYSFSMVDSSGMNNGRAWADAAEGSDVNILEDDMPLADGEVYEGIIIYQMYPDIAPSALLWQPDSGLLNMVVLADGGQSTGGTDTVATPESGDDVATPEADDTDAPVAEATDDEDDAAGEPGVKLSGPADDDEDEGADTASSSSSSSSSSASATASGEVTEINGDPQPILDVIDDEVGTATVVSTQDGWEGYDENANAPIRGTHFFLVTIDAAITVPGGLPMSPIDFTVVTESGEEYSAELYLQNDDADPQITDQGSILPEGETTTLVIAIMIPDGEVPVSVNWNTGPTVVELSLEP